MFRRERLRREPLRLRRNKEQDGCKTSGGIIVNMKGECRRIICETEWFCGILFFVLRQYILVLSREYEQIHNC